MQRILSLDLARGFTVLFIPIVHSVMIYGQPSVHESDFGTALRFIAEWPGAQVFMLLMGVSFELSVKKSFRTTLVKSIVLFILGYLLNALKFGIPYLIGGLPESFLSDMNVNNLGPLLLIGDILQFAGIALLILCLVQKMPDPVSTALLLSIFVCFATPFPLSSNVHILELATGGPPKVFFPVFPWLMYPLAGMVIGNSIKEFGSKVFVALLPIGGGLILSSFCAKLSFSIGPDESFYTMGPWSSLKHLGFVCVWISGFHFLCNVRWNPVFKMLQWMSNKITLIYFIQWPLIFWLLPLFGYHKLNTWECAVIGINVSLLTFLLTLIISSRTLPKIPR